MIYWNVRGDTDGFPVTSSSKDCVMISGFSVSVLKSIFSGKDLKDLTPWDNVKEILDNTRYNPIIDKIRQVAEEPYFSIYNVDIVDNTEIMSSKSGIFSYISDYFK
jgi:hypothetical protein